MFQKLKNLKKEELLMGSIVLFVMMNIFNFLNYVFHFSMARLLGPEDYGVLAVLMSIVYIFSVPAEGVQTVISRYTTRFNIKKEYGKIKYLLTVSIRKTFVISLILFLVYIPIAFALSYFTEIKTGLIVFTGLLLFAMMTVPILRGIMQGRKKFKHLGWNMIIESVIKVLAAIAFVLFGFGVYGAMGAVLLGVSFTLLISFFFIKEVVKSKIKKAEIKEIFAYSFPVLLVMLTIMTMVSIDIIFAKIFFTSEIAGKYAVASMLGKMIFFGTAAIGKAMFPLTSESYDKKQETKRLFKKSLLLTMVLCVVAVLVFLIFPKLVIGILFGKKYLGVSGVLFFVGLAFSFLSLSNLSLIYSLSKHRKRISLFVIFIILEVFVFSFFHSTIKEFSIGFMTINFIMFIFSLIFSNRD